MVDEKAYWKVLILVGKMEIQTVHWTVVKWVEMKVRNAVEKKATMWEY
jgi:hypothetical protein